jgi:hypothetical protein
MHPEASGFNPGQICVWDQLRCSQLIKEVEGASRERLVEFAKELIHHAFVIQPAQVRAMTRLATEMAERPFRSVVSSPEGVALLREKAHPGD